MISDPFVTVCTILRDSSGTSFGLLVSGTSFRCSKELFALSCFAELEFLSAVSLVSTILMMVSIIYFFHIVSALQHAVKFEFTKSPFERTTFSRRYY